MEKPLLRYSNLSNSTILAFQGQGTRSQQNKQQGGIRKAGIYLPDRPLVNNLSYTSLPGLVPSEIHQSQAVTKAVTACLDLSGYLAIPWVCMRILIFPSQPL